MKRFHRDHEINVTRECSLGGDTNVYYSIFRNSDGYECTSGFSTGDETILEFMGLMVARVDAELEDSDPWGESDS